MIAGRLRWCALLAAAVTAPAAAGTSDTALWPTLFVSVRPAKGVIVSGELIDRVTDGVSREGQLETRLQVGHPLTSRITVWAGWVHFATYAKVGRDGIEDHAVEQLNWNAGKIGPISVALRTRLEQRAIRGVDTPSWRLRQQLRLAVPLGEHGAALVLWGEPFVALNRTAAQPGFLERTRSFVGVSVPVARRVELEAGYLNQYLPRPAGDRVDHAFPIALNFRL